MEQGTKEWFEARKGKFTSSEIHKIMGSKGIGKTGFTYIAEVVGEQFSEFVKEEVFSKALQWGKDNEPKVKRFLIKEKGFDIIESGFTPSEFEFFGGSLDGWDRNTDSVIEIKCPYNTGNHIKHGLNCQDLETFKKEVKEYYWQLVGNCFSMNTNRCFFVSFDPRINSNLGLIIKQFEIPQEDIDLLKERLQEANQIRLEIIEKLTPLTK